MTPEEADKLLVTLYAGYPFADNGLKPEQAKARKLLYRSLVQKWSFVSAMSAAEQVIRTSEFFPTLAVLEAAYREIGRPHPERVALPAAGKDMATPEQVKAACEEALAIVERNAGLRKT